MEEMVDETKGRLESVIDKIGEGVRTWKGQRQSVGKGNGEMGVGQTQDGEGVGQTQDGEGVGQTQDGEGVVRAKEGRGQDGKRGPGSGEEHRQDMLKEMGTGQRQDGWRWKERT